MGKGKTIPLKCKALKERAENNNNNNDDDNNNNSDRKGRSC